MSWCNAMAGQEIRLSSRARARFGMGPASLEDTGVVENAREVGELLQYGLELGGIDAPRVEGFTQIEHGTARQVNEAGQLAGETMATLKARVQVIVSERLRNVPHGDDKELNRLLEWAEGEWELSATFGDGDGLGTRLRLHNPGGVAVLVCPVFHIPKGRGDTLCALLTVLCREAMKATATEIVSYWYERLGFTMKSLDAQERERVSAMTKDAAREWIEQQDPSGVEEAMFLMGEEGLHENFAHDLCKTLCLISEFAERVERVAGRGASVEEGLSRVEAQACQWPTDDPLRVFVEACCRALRAGASTRELLDKTLTDEDFEIMPGEWEIVDFGIDLPMEHEIYGELNDAVCHDGEVGSMPLRMPTEDLVALLARITVAERLIVRLASLLP